MPYVITISYLTTIKLTMRNSSTAVVMQVRGAYLESLSRLVLQVKHFFLAVPNLRFRSN